MNGNTCFKVNNTIFKVNDIINEKMYIFVGNVSSTQAIINKINNEGTKSLNKEEKSKLKEYYGDSLKLSDITSKTKLIPCFINLFDSIDVIKKKIMKFINNNSLPNEQLIWINKKKITLGFEYVSNDEEILDLNLNLLNSKFNPEGIPISYTLKDTVHYILSNYTLQSEVINYISYEDYYNRYKDNINFELIKSIYFPKLNKNSISINDYNSILMNNLSVESNFYNSLDRLKDDYKFKECLLKNIVLKGKQNNLNLQHIFSELKVNSKIVFIKYKTADKNNFYKVFTKPKFIKKVYREFDNPKNYILNYEKGFHNQILPKNELNKFNQKTISFKEKQFFKRDKDMDIEIKYKSYIILKIHWKNDIYFEIEIKQNEVFIRLLMDDFFINYADIVDIIEQTNIIIKNLNKTIKIKIDLLTVNNVKFVSCDSSNLINLKNINIKKLQNHLKYYLYYLYKIEPEFSNKNSVYFKCKLVDNFNEFENIKRHFIKIKKANPQLSISDFKTEWITESRNMFGLSDTDALNYLTQITEIVSQTDLNNSQVDIDIDVTFTKKTYDSELDLFIYELNINNASNLYILEVVKNLVSVILFDFLEKKEITQNTMKVKIEESKIEVKQLEIKDEEEEFDLDDDFIDLEENNLEEEEENENAQQNKINILEQEEEVDIDIEEMLEEKQEQIMEEDNKKYVELNNNFFKGKTHSLTNYMKSMRTIDNKLFNFADEGDKYKSYSKKCQAVQMKQPIIVTKLGMRNIERRNPEAFKLITKLEWGSSRESKNFYLCPRIWCIRDKLVLLPKDLIRNSSGKLVCRFCKGEIIDSESKRIKDNQTVIIRNIGEDAYWDNPNLRKKDQPKELDGSEQYAFPTLLPPNAHPEGMCMPCCNKSRSWNFNKCMKVEVDYCSQLPDIDPINLKPGSIIEGQQLYENDTIILINTDKNNIYTVTKNGGEIKVYLTTLEIKIKSGMVFEIKRGKYKDQQYKVIIDNVITEIIRKKTDLEKGDWKDLSISSDIEETQLKIKGFEEENYKKSLEIDDKLKIIHNNKIYKNKEYEIIKASYNDNYIIVQGDIDIDIKEGLTLWQLTNIRFLKIENVKSDKYVSGPEKFPLKENKYGMLSYELDRILNEKKVKIEKSRVINNAKIFVRKGINQKPNVSFISSIASILGMTYIEIIFKVIRNLTPELFISLNNGEIYKQFTGPLENINKDTINYKSFIKWCYTYSNFVNLYNKLYFDDESSFLNILKTKRDTPEVKKELIKKMIEKLEQHGEKLFNIAKYKLLMNIYNSFENYKKFWGDLNTEKQPIYVLDLLSRNHLWLNNDYNGLNILILEQKKNKVFVNCPISDNVDNIYNKNKSTCLIYKFRGIYEPIIIVNETMDSKTKQRYLKEYSYFNDKIKYNKFLLTVVDTIFKIAVLNCSSSINNDYNFLYNKIQYENLPSIINTLTFFKMLKDEKLQPKKIIIDPYFKGIGLLLNNNFLIFTAAFGMDIAEEHNLQVSGLNNISLMDFESLKKEIKLINKEINLEKQKLNLKIKKIEKSTSSKEIITVKINKVIRQLNTYPNQIGIQNLIIDKDKNKLSAVVLENGSFHPLSREEYKPEGIHKMKVEPLHLNYFLNIDLENNVIENESVSFNYNYYRNLEKYLCFKNQFRSFFNYKNRHLNTLKEHIYGIIDNPVLLLSKKRELLLDVILSISKELFQVVDNDSSIKYSKNKVCYITSYKDCSSGNKNSQCHFKSKTSNNAHVLSLRIEDKDLNFNITRCKLKLIDSDISIFIFKLIAELLNSYKNRIDILENSTLDLEYDDSVILTDNFEEEIEKLYEKKNIYLQSKLSKIALNKKNPVLSNELTSELIHVLKIQNEPQKLKDLDPEKYDLEQLSQLFPPPGVPSTVIDIIEQNSNIESNIKKCSSDKLALTISTKGRVEKKDDPMVKEGPCCFPFKDIGQGNKINEFNDWKEKIIDGKREPICATSVFTEEENSEKVNYLKTYGFAPEGTIIKRKKVIKPKIKDESVKKEIKPKIIKPKIIETDNTASIFERKTIKGEQCKIPFKIATGKGKDKKIIEKKNCTTEEVENNKKNIGEWCPIKLNEEGMLASKHTRKLGIDYDYCEDTETIEKLKEENKWQGPFEKTFLADLSKSSNFINPKKPLRSLKEAIKKCEEDSECKGISHDMEKNNYKLSKYTNKITPDSQGTRVKEQHRKDAEKYRAWIKN